MATHTMTQAEMDQWEADRRTGPWKCFNCGEVFTDCEAAADHFQPDDVGDTYGWSAACVDPLRSDEKERHAEIIDVHRELEGEREAHHQTQQRIAALEAENAKLRDGLSKAAAQFEFYQGQHEAKGTREGREKARTNADMASMCRALLQGGPDAG